MIFDLFYLKYRGYSEEKNKWLYGYHVDDGKHSYIFDTDSKEMIHISSDTLLVKASLIDKRSLGLRTLENDIDGKELYTGDVLLTTTGENSPFSEEFYIMVVYERQGFYGVYADDFIEAEDFEFCKLQGNVYENRELFYLCSNGNEYEIDEDI